MPVLMSYVKPEFGLVCAVAGCSVLLHHAYMSLKVSAARRKHGVPFPAMYADASHANANVFNCIQRAHQNSLENQPAFLTMLTLTGLQYPVTAAAAGVVYLIGRVMYFNGYSTGDPAKRMQGAIGYLGTLTLLGTLFKTSYDLLSQSR